MNSRIEAAVLRILRKHSSRLEELKLRALANPWDGRGVPDARRLVAPGELDREIWISLLREHLKLAWIEPPASPFDIYRTSQASRYVTHVRLFTDLVGRPIKPEGEVYHLKPWPGETVL